MVLSSPVHSGRHLHHHLSLELDALFLCLYCCAEVMFVLVEDLTVDVEVAAGEDLQLSGTATDNQTLRDVH